MASPIVSAPSGQRDSTTAPSGPAAGRDAPQLSSANRPQPLTFVFTDIEGSTRLLEQVGAGYADVLSIHGRLISEAASRNAGEVVDTQGDSFFLVFATTDHAVAFATSAQRALAGEEWPADAQVRVRMGIHTGEATRSATGYVGLDVHRAARICNAAHGGQVLLSAEAAQRIADDQVTGVGAHGLKDFPEPVALHQLVISGLQADFPPPRTFEEPDQPPAPGEPPYQGLAHFEEADAERFFGREELVGQLVGRLEEHPFLAVIGASGSGKSSVVRAGLIPAMRARGIKKVTLLTPTAEPFATLAAALTPNAGANERSELAQLLRANQTALGERLGPGSLLVVDQAEELFSLCRDESERVAFVERLLSAAQAGGLVVLSLRADFYERLAGYPALRSAVAAHQEYLGLMSTDELRAAIGGPAKAGGWRFDAGLVDLILHDVGSEPGALPLLSHALLETWQRRRGRLLMLRGYLDAGRVQGAIARSADRLMAELDPRQQDIARSILLRLTEFGSDTPDTRRRATRDELLSREESGSTSEVLQRLADSRLVVLGEETAEVAHEALIREWPTLREWLAADREALHLHRSVTDAAGEWQRAGREPSLLFRGARLAAALDWAPEHQAELNALEREFIDESRLASEREAQRQRTVNRRLRFLLAGAGVFLILALGAGAYAALEAGRAEQGELLAQSRELAASAIAVLDEDPELSILLALQAVEMGGEAAPEAVTALHRAVQAARSIFHVQLEEPPLIPHSIGVALSPDGETLYASADSRSVRVYDVVSGSLSRVLGRPGEDTERGFLSVVVSQDGSRVATVDEDAVVHVWNTDDWTESQFQAQGSGADWPAFSHDGTMLATLTADPEAEGSVISVWNVAEAAELRVWRLPLVYAVSFHPNGRQLLATACVCEPERAVMLLDIETGEQEVAVDNVDGLLGSRPVAAQFSPDGTMLATAGIDGRVHLWGTSGDKIRTFPGHTREASYVVFSPDGSRLATTSQDGTTRIWDVEGGHELLALRGQGGVPLFASFSADGRRVATGSSNLTVRVWDLSPARVGEIEGYEIGRPYKIDTPVAVIDIDVRGDLLAVLTAACDNCRGQADVLSRTTDDHIVVPVIGTSIALYPDGTSLLAQAILDAEEGGAFEESAIPEEGRYALGPVQKYLLWSGEVAFPFEGNCPYHAGEWGSHCALPPEVPWEDNVRRMTFSADGSLIAMVGWVDPTGSLAVWDAGGRLISGPTTFEEVRTRGVAFSPDGSKLAVSMSGDYVLILDALTLEETRRLSITSPWDRLEFSPDGSQLVVTSTASRTRVYDIATWNYTELPTQSHSVDFSADGDRFLTLDNDRTMRIWDASTLLELRAVPVAGSTANVGRLSARFLEDERHAVTFSDGALVVMALDTDELLRVARERVARSLTEAECEKYHLEDCAAAQHDQTAGP
jgi:WD40 repeat protein/class 3 adenylate cyclase